MVLLLLILELAYSSYSFTSTMHSKCPFKETISSFKKEEKEANIINIQLFS
jgi:hypothetical protein